MDAKKLRDTFYGCILGGAFGDALGYPVEFMSWKEIKRQYGADGIGFLKPSAGAPRVSDDTQMTLFTMAGMTTGIARANYKGIGAPMPAYINWAYCDWLFTQKEESDYQPFTALYRLPELHVRRLPGNCCLHELEAQLQDSPCPPFSNRYADLEHRVNENKGCGGVMRVAPVGLMMNEDNRRFYPGTAAGLGAEAAAITHGHPLGWLSAALHAQIVYNCLRRTPQDTVLDVIRRSMAQVAEEFAHVPETKELMELCERAIALAGRKFGNDVKAIHSIGGGWVGEEALAVAIYACVHFPQNFYAAICCAVNHDGDSDSTGAIAGNILGAYMGFDAINSQLREENIDLMKIEMAEEMCELCDVAIRMSYGEPEEHKDPTGRTEAVFPVGLYGREWECAQGQR